MATGGDFAAGSNDVGLDLYRLIARGPGNRVFSPASATLAMTMTWAGARGETAAQMREVLRLDGSPEVVSAAAGRLAAGLVRTSAPSLLRIANRLFGDSRCRIEPAFLDLSAAAFGAPLEAVSFADAAGAVRRINGWVAAQTDDRIRDLLPENAVGADTRLVLVNAVYLLGKWLHPFPTRQTRIRPFSVSPTEQKPVPTMHRTGDVRYARGQGFTAVELPYEGGLSMLVVLPERVDGVGDLESSLTANGLERLMASLAFEHVEIALPRFEISPPAVSLTDAFRGLGLSLPFDSARADFTGIANPPDPADQLYITEVFHKAFVRTDEAGTEAAATLAISMALRGGGPRALEFTADHPFLFFIVHAPTRLILFMGRVADPTRTG
jgi:serpin B